jgi:hypothetical protein
MLTTKEIKIPATPEHIIQKNVRTCDICGKEGNTVMCVQCRRDACNSYYTDCSTYDSRHHGDYPDRYCKICHEIKFVKYEEEYQEILKEQETKEKVLDKKITEESLATKI